MGWDGMGWDDMGTVSLNVKVLVDIVTWSLGPRNVRYFVTFVPGPAYITVQDTIIPL